MKSNTRFHPRQLFGLHFMFSLFKQFEINKIPQITQVPARIRLFTINISMQTSTINITCECIAKSVKFIAFYEMIQQQQAKCTRYTQHAEIPIMKKDGKKLTPDNQLYSFLNELHSIITTMFGVRAMSKKQKGKAEH